MISIARLSDSDRQEMFRNTADKKGLNDAIVEKEMNKFEFFTMIFYALDLYYDESPSEELGNFLSEMSPITFKRVDSADPAVYADFCDFLGDKDKIAIEDGYDIALQYLKTIKEIDAVTPFLVTTREEWCEGCENYLSEPHKGQNMEEQ